MANTRQSTKRARVEAKRTKNNQVNRSLTKTAVRQAVAAIAGSAKGDLKTVQAAYLDAVKALASRESLLGQACKRCPDIDRAAEIVQQWIVDLGSAGNAD